MIANMFFSEDFIENRDMNNNPIPTVIGPTSEFGLINFPTNYTFTLQVMISKLKVNNQVNVTITFSRVSDEALLLSENVVLPIKEDDSEVNVNFNMGFRNTLIEEEGVYIARLFVDGVMVRDCEVNMAKARTE